MKYVLIKTILVNKLYSTTEIIYLPTYEMHIMNALTTFLNYAYLEIPKISPIIVTYVKSYDI